ncbi:MAG: glycoside hydrolase family 78 protein [Pirellulales bacterium]|nr:glycoside hydrolase family 78 protein [Pirellulales bacterium]
MRCFTVFFVSLLGLACPAFAESPAVAEHLRCEYRVDPLGIDVVGPRLSWEMRDQRRGAKQTAYQVLVASTPEKLAAGQGDLWNSGKVESNETMQIVYEGKPLGSRDYACWKVRLWDQDGQTSAWSASAKWSMGLLKKADWNGAEWIACPSETPVILSPHNGYHSQFAKTADTEKWAAINLGQEQKIDAVQLFPARPYDFSPDTPGFLFPVRFKIEAANKPNFSDAKTVVDKTDADYPNPGEKAPTFRFDPVEAKLVRVTATRLGRLGDHFGLALAEAKVFSGGKNVSEQAGAYAKDSIEQGGWSMEKLTDGRIRGERSPEDAAERLASIVRKEFKVSGPIRRAVVSVTGLGLYELHINGHKVGDHLLTPEWTRYQNRIQYQTYDVTDRLKQGENTVGAYLGNGWWPALAACAPPRAIDNPQPCLLMRLDVEMEDGTTQTIVSNDSWQATDESPIEKCGIYVGETYDATKELPGWDEPGFDAADWSAVKVLPCPAGSEEAKLVAQPNEPIRVEQELSPVKITEPKPGVYVFDMGQNMVGWCRLKTSAPKGTKITMRHGELLNDDGTVYQGNLGPAVQTDEFTCPGGEATYEPRFTYHGFRYVQVTGLPQPPTKETLTGRVFHSDSPEVGTFSCSNQLINQIKHLIDWVQRGNMHGVPTDCPQRSERLGWMGDIQAFGQTAIFNRDMAAFFTKWIPDVRDSQAEDGRYADFSPHFSDPNKSFSGVPAWGDAGVVVPWRMYQNYADKRMLEQHFDSVCRWIDYIHEKNPNLLWQKNRGNDYNDWLHGDTLDRLDYPKGISEVPREVFATAFWAGSTEMAAKMAKVLGRTEEAEKFGQLHEGIKKAFNRAFVQPDGHIQGDTQAGYALALYFNLLDDAMRPKAAAHLVEAIRKFKDHPSTGIQTTHRLMLELSRNGQHDEAYRLINLRTAPSWGFMVEMDATTIWERWDGYVKGRGIHRSGMNSFNHWAFGAVGEWMWRELAGINPDEAHPGFKHFIIRPRPVGDLKWVKSTYDSIRGPIVSNWKRDGGVFSLDVEVPANTTATVYVPARDAGAVTEGGVPASQAEGVKFLRMEDGTAVFAVAAGRYTFAAPETKSTE